MKFKQCFMENMAREHFKKHGAEHYWGLDWVNLGWRSLAETAVNPGLSPFAALFSPHPTLIHNPLQLGCVISDRCQAHVGAKRKNLAPNPQLSAFLYPLIAYD